MELFKVLLELITLPAFILGLIALVGLLIQKKSTSEVIVGTFKTILGLLIMSIGIGALINALIPIQAMFQVGIPAAGFETFVTFDEAVVGAVQSANEANIGAAIAWTMLFGYIIHLVLAGLGGVGLLRLLGVGIPLGFGLVGGILVAVPFLLLLGEEPRAWFRGKSDDA